MEDRINEIIDMSEALADLPAGAYHSPLRQSQYQLCRATANNLIMRELSVDYNTLSHYVESRDRSTLYVHYKNHDDNMSGWKDYKLFYTALKAKFLSGESEQGFVDSDKFIQILNRNGIPDHKGMDRDDPKSSITISIGRFKGKLYRSAKYMPSTIKKLLIAFMDYEYDIIIKKVQRYERIYKTT